MEGTVALEWVVIGRQDAFSGLGVTHDVYVDRVTNNRARQESQAITAPYLLVGWMAFVPIASPISEFAELTSIAVATAVIAGGEWLMLYEKWLGGPPPFEPLTIAAVPPTD